MIELAIFINIIFLLFVLTMACRALLTPGQFMPIEDGLSATAFVTYLSINILALRKKCTNSNIHAIWPFIIFKRLALQEKKKIQELEKE